MTVILVKHFRVLSILFAHGFESVLRNRPETPVQVTLEDKDNPAKEANNAALLFVDYASLGQQFVIHQDAKLAENSIITCMLESRLLPTCGMQSPNAGAVDRSSLTTKDLIIQELLAEEHIFPAWDMKPPSKRAHKRQQLKLVSFGTRFNGPFALSCPWYEINLGLTEQEFQACKQLSPVTCFTVQFTVT